MEVEIISKEAIKPSKPTPSHNKLYQLSSLDQLSPSIYVPILLFYQAPPSTPHTHATQLLQLKNSLSETLTYYYPFAGKIKDGAYIDCDDTGVLFFEAQTNNNLVDILTLPDIEALSFLFPDKLQWKSSRNSSVLAVQFSNFNCGGFSIGICISHKIADACSIVTFLKDWASQARVSHESMSPLLTTTLIFPPSEHFVVPEIEPVKGNVITRRYVFHPAQIAELKAAIVSNRGVQQARDPVKARHWSGYNRSGPSICKTGRSLSRSICFYDGPGWVKPLYNIIFSLLTGLYKAKKICAEWAGTGLKTDGSDPARPIYVKKNGLDRNKINLTRSVPSHCTPLVSNSKVTRVEAVTSFIFKSIIRASKTRSLGLVKSYLLAQIVNLRPRMLPPLQKASIGNIVWYFPIMVEDNDDISLERLATQMREGLEELCHVVRNVEGKEWVLKATESENNARTHSMNDAYKFSSWCKYPVYEVDFGWGSPIWVSGSDHPYKNNIFLMDTKDGEGIEAWVTLDEEVMYVLQGDEEFCKVASMNPSIFY